MPGWSPTVKLLGLSVLTICFWFMAQRRARGEPPAPTPSIADLEKRIRELEDIVKRLQAERAPKPVTPPGSSSEPAPEQASKEKDQGKATGSTRPFAWGRDRTA
jgi:hypothetical protein